MEYRLGLRAEGKIRFLSGKQEMIRLGVLDDACVALKYHSMSDTPERVATINGTLNGFIAKRASFLGRSAHAGAWPEKGINALNAASLALLAIHAQRETFRDDDHIRVHPVMKSGGRHREHRARPGGAGDLRPRRLLARHPGCQRQGGQGPGLGRGRRRGCASG